MTANVVFAVNSKKDILLVPTEFIKYVNGKAIVLSKAEGSKEPPTEKEIQLGVSDGKMSEITGGLDEGESIVMAQNLNKKEKSNSPFSPMGGTRPRGK
jgi:multidrug efflux pump subunit AcrA (membrane-fusion protein)